jgi:hypothetical protein
MLVLSLVILSLPLPPPARRIQSPVLASKLPSHRGDPNQILAGDTNSASRLEALVMVAQPPLPGSPRNIGER